MKSGQVRRDQTTTYGLSLDNLVPLDRLGDFINLVGHVLGCRPSVGHIVLYPKVIVRTPRIMTRREEDTTVGLVLSDDVGGGGGGQDRVLADDKLCHAVGGSDLEDGLDGFWGKEAAVAADDEGGALCGDGIKDGLDKVFGVVLQERGGLERARSRNGNTSVAYGLLEHFDPVSRSVRRIQGDQRRGRTDLFLNPDVPGFWPSKGLVGISLTGWVIVADGAQNARPFMLVSHVT